MCRNDREKVVGATGFEPATPCAQGRCATRLRYAPTLNAYDSIALVSRILAALSQNVVNREDLLAFYQQSKRKVA